jgi:hypothetical protein
VRRSAEQDRVNTNRARRADDGGETSSDNKEPASSRGLIVPWCDMTVSVATIQASPKCKCKSESKSKSNSKVQVSAATYPACAASVTINHLVPFAGCCQGLTADTWARLFPR